MTTTPSKMGDNPSAFTTENASPVVAWSSPIDDTLEFPEKTTATVSVLVSAIDTSGDSAGYFIIGSFKRAAGGSLTAVAVSTLATHEDDASWSATLAAGADRVELTVTGDAANKTTWAWQASASVVKARS